MDGEQIPIGVTMPQDFGRDEIRRNLAERYAVAAETHRYENVLHSREVANHW